MYSAVAFYARMRIIQESAVHTIPIMDGGYFCLPPILAPPCGKTVNILGPPYLKHIRDFFRNFWGFPLFQTLRIKRDICNIFLSHCFKFA
jgi:hypothetical protein